MRSISKRILKENIILRRVLFSILFILTTAASAIAQVNVKGKIVDANDEPIIGASVVVKNTTTGTVSDIDGNYEIVVPNNDATLVFSFIGYLKQELQVGTKRPLNVVLQEDSKTLDEVVVVGYTAIKKQSLTGALETVDSKKLIDATTPSVENLLQGKATGVYVNTGSGQPGELGKIIIRGKTTVNGSTDPLWVIDGVIMGANPATLNPNDVETITILKDAASTAIYGSQGANGVIVVSTKSGKSGKASINVSSRIAATTLNKGNFAMMNGEELYDFYNSFSNREILSNKSWWTPELRNRNFDWFKNGTQTGFAQDHNVTISGGTDKLKAYSSINLYDETGAVKGYDFNRYNMLLKVDYKVLDWLTIRPQVNATYTKTEDRQQDVYAMYLNLPWDSPFNTDGTLVGNRPNPTWVNSEGNNYLYDLQWNYSNTDMYDVFLSFDFDIKLTDWLTFASVNNYKFAQTNQTTYTDPRSAGGLATHGAIQDIMESYNRRYTNQLFRINKSFDKHSINAVAGYEWNEFNSKRTDQIVTNIAGGLDAADTGATPQQTRGNRGAWAVQSLLSNVNYNYANRYLAQVSLRRDGASNFGLNTQYGNFFSLSGGWNISEEDFFKIKNIDRLKIRASYGSVGNRPTSYYPQFTIYSAQRISYNGEPGALLSQIGDKNLSWEKSFVSGLGIDLTAWNRLNMSIDLYHKNTSDLLFQLPVSILTGVTNIWSNVGEIQNKGFEVSADIDIIRNKDWKWNVDANIGINRNKITKLYGKMEQIVVGDGSGISGSASKLLKPGMDMDTWYLAEWAGVNPETGDPQWYATNEQGERVLTSKYSDAVKTAIPIGAYTPKFFGGFGTHLTYKEFDFAAVLSYSVGGKIYNYARSEFDSDGAYTDFNYMRLQDGWSRWEKPGDIATHPKPMSGNRSNSNKASSRYLEDGSYLKVRSLTLGYTIPIRKLNISNLRIFVAGENLLTFTGFSGVDPEIPPIQKSGTSNVNPSMRNTVATGVATSVYPQVRRFTFGLNVLF